MSAWLYFKETQRILKTKWVFLTFPASRWCLHSLTYRFLPQSFKAATLLFIYFFTLLPSSILKNLCYWSWGCSLVMEQLSLHEWHPGFKPQHHKTNKQNSLLLDWAHPDTPVCAPFLKISLIVTLTPFATVISPLSSTMVWMSAPQIHVAV